MPKTIQSPKNQLSPTPLGYRRSSRSSAMAYVPGQNDVAAIQKKERNSTNKARKALAYATKRAKQVAKQKKIEKARLAKENEFLEKELSTTTVWTPERITKLSAKVQELIDLCVKVHPDAECFWYREELMSIMEDHEVVEFSYYGVPDKFLTDLANFTLRSIHFEMHAKKGHTTWEYRASVVAAFNELQDLLKTPDYEQYSIETTDIIEQCLEKHGIDEDEAMDVDNMSMDAIVDLKDICTSQVRALQGAVKRKKAVDAIELKRKQRREYMRRYRCKKVQEVKPAPKIVINRHQGGIISKYKKLVITPLKEDSESESEPETVVEDYEDDESDDEDAFGMVPLTEMKSSESDASSGWSAPVTSASVDDALAELYHEQDKFNQKAH